MNKIKEVLVRSISVMLMVTLLSTLAGFDIARILGAIEVQAATTKTVEEAMEWVENQEGKKIGDGECVMFIKAYYAALGANIVPSGDAWKYSYSSKTLPTGWKRLQGVAPQVGDILIYVGSGANHDGQHVAICGGSNIMWHQNYSNSSKESLAEKQKVKTTIRACVYGTYWGVIRPDFLVKTTGITLIEKEIKVRKNQFPTGGIVLHATVSPSNASYKNITWSSSDTSVAVVQSDGTLRPTGKRGTAVITAKAYNGQTATCKFTHK